MPSAGAPADPASSHRAIENLIATYAELVDDGDFAGVGHVLADATFIGRNVPFTGRDAIETTASNATTRDGASWSGACTSTSSET
jgi:hypothetical protein